MVYTSAGSSNRSGTLFERSVLGTVALVACTSPTEHGIGVSIAMAMPIAMPIAISAVTYSSGLLS